MNCSIENREERLLDYVSGSLDAHEAALFEKHLETCSECSGFVAGQKAVWTSLDLFEPAPVSDDFNRRLNARIEQTSWWDRLVARIASPFGAPAFVRRGVPVAATAALIAAGVVVWQRPAHSPAPARPAALSADADSLQPDRVQRALDDMEMLRQFNRFVDSGTAQ